MNPGKGFLWHAPEKQVIYVCLPCIRYTRILSGNKQTQIACHKKSIFPFAPAPNLSCILVIGIFKNHRMKKTALSLFHSLLCIISATAQAPGALIELSDSIVFEERQGYLFKNGRGICRHIRANNRLRVVCRPLPRPHFAYVQPTGSGYAHSEKQPVFAPLVSGYCGVRPR